MAVAVETSGQHTEEFSKTLTEEQRKAPSYLDWDDATIAGAVRALAKDLFEVDIEGFRAIQTVASTIVLCDNLKETNADTIDAKLKQGGKTFRIVVKEIKPRKKKVKEA